MTDFREILKYQVSSKSVQWEQSCSMRAGGHDEANSRFSQFWERAWKRDKHGARSCRSRNWGYEAAL